MAIADGFPVDACSADGACGRAVRCVAPRSAYREAGAAGVVGGRGAGRMRSVRLRGAGRDGGAGRCALGPRHRVVRGPGGRGRPRLRPLQRDVGRLLPAGDDGARGRSARLRRRRRPRRVPGAGRSARYRDAAHAAAGGAAAGRSAVPERPGGPAGRDAHAPLHRRHGRERGAGRRLRHGRGGGRLRQRRPGGSVPDPLRTEPDAAQPRRRDVRRRVGRDRRRRAVVGGARVVPRLRPGTAGWICSSATT